MLALGFRFRVEGLGLRAQDVGLEIWGLGALARRAQKKEKKSRGSGTPRRLGDLAEGVEVELALDYDGKVVEIDGACMPPTDVTPRGAWLRHIYISPPLIRSTHANVTC